MLDLAEADVAALRGEWAAAVTAYRQALARPGRYLLRPVVLLRLGDVQRARGDLDAARDAWTQAADCPVDIQAVVDARQRLRETSPAAS